LSRTFFIFLQISFRFVFFAAPLTSACVFYQTFPVLSSVIFTFFVIFPQKREAGNGPPKNRQ